MADVEEDPIVAALASGVGRSPVYRWLRQNHERVEAALARIGGRPNWQGLAELLAREKVRDGRGKAPSAHTLRVQWLEVRRDLARLRGEMPAAVSKAPPEEAAQAEVKPVVRGGDDELGLTFAGGRK